MSICIYDNPITMCREAWQNGNMLAHLHSALVDSKGFNGFPSMPFYLGDKSPFDPGRLLGDRQALGG